MASAEDLGAEKALSDHLNSCELCSSNRAVTAAAPTPSRGLAAAKTEADPGRGSAAAAATVPGRRARVSSTPIGPAVRVGRFVLGKEIGRGGMGVVYKANDLELDRTVALKFLTTENVSAIWRSKLVRRFRREGQAMAKLSHPNVVQIYEVGEHEGQVFLAMEYVDGTDLSDWLSNETLKTQEVVEVFLAAGAGLDAAHSEGLIHRDFKPSNVLISKQGEVKVTDFGLARLGNEDSELPAEDARFRSRHDLLGAQMTQTGGLVGTPPFMSPEQLAGRPLDTRSDIFSFGVGLFYGLYGKLPFDGDDHASLGESIASEELSAEVSDRGRVPRVVEQAIRRSLRHDPAERFSSISEMLDELKPPKVGKTVGLTAVVAALGVGALALFGMSNNQAEPCQTGAAEITASWNDDVRASLVANVAGTEEQVGSMLGRLAAYSEKWADTRDRVCRATRVDGKQSKALLDVRMSCLDDTKAALRFAAEAIARAGTTIDADRVISRLPHLSLCASLDSRTGEDQDVPQDRVNRERISAAQRELSRAQASYLAAPRGGAAMEFLSQIAKTRAFSDKIDNLPLWIEATEAQGRVELELGQFENAETSFRHLLVRVQSSEIRGRVLRLRVQVGLTEALSGQGRLQEAKQQSVIAAGLLRTVDPADIEARLHFAIGRAFAHALQFDFAEAAFERTEKSVIRGGLANSEVGIRLDLARGRNSLRMGRYPAATSSLKAAHEKGVRLGGENHRVALEALRLVGVAHYRAGEANAAESAFRTLVSKEADPRDRFFLAHALLDLGRDDEGRELLTMPPIKIRDYLKMKAVEPLELEAHAEAVVLFAEAQWRLGDVDTAKETFRTAMVRRGRMVFENPKDMRSVNPVPVIVMALAFAENLEAADQLDEALVEAELASRLAKKRVSHIKSGGRSTVVVGHGHDWLLEGALVRHASILEKLGRAAEARPEIFYAGRQHASEKMSRTPAPPAAEAEMSLVAARVYWATRMDRKDPVRAGEYAIELATTAETLWKEFGGRDAERAKEATAWLKSRSAPP